MVDQPDPLPIPDDGVTEAEDVWAWGAIFLDDGRVVSLASLRGYPGAVESRWRTDSDRDEAGEWA